MNVKPLGNRVLVKPGVKKSRSKGGFILSAATTYEKTEEIHGDVMAIGPDVQIVKVGDLVSYPAYGYDTVTDDSSNAENEYMCIREPEILAVLDRVVEEPGTTESSNATSSISGHHG